MTKKQDLVSWVELKRLAVRRLPKDSALRSVILSEPDYLPRQQTIPKLEVMVKLVYHELGN